MFFDIEILLPVQEDVYAAFKFRRIVRSAEPHRCGLAVVWRQTPRRRPLPACAGCRTDLHQGLVMCMLARPLAQDHVAGLLRL